MRRTLFRNENMQDTNEHSFGKRMRPCGWCGRTSVYTMMYEVCPQIPVKAEKCHLLMKPQVVSLILSGINTVEKRRAMNRIEKI